MNFHASIVIPIFLILWSEITTDELLPFEDIPIESYNHEQIDGDTIDGGELLPRLSRSSPAEDSANKEVFFEYIRAYNGDSDSGSDAPIRNLEDLPKPGGFRIYYSPKNGEVISRQRRDLGRRPSGLRVAVLQPGQSILATTVSKSPVALVENEEALDRGMLENYALRYRRNAAEVFKDDSGKLNLSDTEDIDSLVSNLTKSEDNSRPKRNHIHSEADEFSMDPDDFSMENLREARGATTEHWIKQPYPVQPIDYDDNSPSSSDNLKAPRVHFVTQRRSESSPPTFYRNYEREPRARELSKEPPIFTREPAGDLARDIATNVRTSLRDFPSSSYYDNYYQPRFSRNYNYKRQRFDPYYYYDEQERYHHNPRVESSPDRNRYTTYSANKQRRIIYYATLPEVVRSPPNVDLRDRFGYRDRYDDKFPSSPLSQLDPFRYRKPFTKPRYEEDIERSKTPYPLKVSTDVNVREIKKNPERRIYSEVDRNRYGFKQSQPNYSNS